MEEKSPKSCCSFCDKGKEWATNTEKSIEKSYEEETGQPVENALFVGSLLYILLESAYDVYLVVSEYDLSLAVDEYYKVNGTEYDAREYSVFKNESFWAIFNELGEFERGIDFESEVIEVFESELITALPVYAFFFASAGILLACGIIIFYFREVKVLLSYVLYKLFIYLPTKFRGETVDFRDFTLFVEYEKTEIESSILARPKGLSLFADVLIFGILMAPPCEQLGAKNLFFLMLFATPLLYEGSRFLLDKKADRYFIGIFYWFCLPLSLLPVVLEIFNVFEVEETTSFDLLFFFSLFWWPCLLIFIQRLKHGDRAVIRDQIILPVLTFTITYMNGLAFCLYYSLNDYPAYLCNFGYFMFSVVVCYCLVPFCTFLKVLLYDCCEHPNENLRERFFRYFLDDKSALHQNVLFQNVKKVRFALGQGVDIENKDCYGATCLMTACKIGKLDMVKLLLENGADIRVRDNKENGVLKYVADKEKVTEEDIEIALFLIKNGVDVNAQNKFDKTILFAVKDITMAAALIENGTDVNVQDNHGATALHRAAKAGQEGIVKFLLENGADMNLCDNKGKTARDYATGCLPCFSNSNIISLLKEHEKKQLI